MLAATGSVSSRSFFLVETSHSSTRPCSARDRQRPPVRAEVDPLPPRPATIAAAADRAPGRRVPESGPAQRHGRQERAVRAERRGDDGRVESLEPRADPRAVLERAQERAARIDRIVEAARLQREEERRDPDAAPPPRATEQRAVRPVRRAPCAARPSAARARTPPAASAASSRTARAATSSGAAGCAAAPSRPRSAPPRRAALEEFALAAR